MCGHQMSVQTSDLMEQAVTGFGRMNMNGCGFQTIHGAGRLFIMADGCMIRFMDGSGFRGMNGRLPGLPGDTEAIIMVGLL